MRKHKILKTFNDNNNIDPKFRDKFDWFLNFLKENKIKYTFDSERTLIIWAKDGVLEIPYHKQGRKKTY